MEKLDAFNRFRNEATPSRVIAVLLMALTPSLLASLVNETIPLADPATRFWGSLNFQIRNFLTAMIMAAVPVLMKITSASQQPLQSRKFAVGFGLTVAATAISTNAIIAQFADCFPVPFTQFVPAVPMAMVGSLINYRFMQKPETEARFDKIDQWAAMDMLPIVVYPFFTAAFMALRPYQQL